MSKSKQLTVSIIIPNFNGEKLLANNLPEVISAWENKENQISEVIVIDDGSTDGSVNLIKKEYPRVKLIKHKINRGFVSAVNTGVRSSGGELVALINTDVVPENNFLVSVLPHFENNEVFAVSLHEVGFGWAKGVFSDGFIAHAPGEESNNPHLSFWASGGSGVFRREIWMELGGMDEVLLSPYYWEDIDLAYRAQKRGYVVYWEPKAYVTHEHESTMKTLNEGHVQRVRERNQLLVTWKNLTCQVLIRKHLMGLVRKILRHPGYFRIVFMALTRLKPTLLARRREIKESKVSDEAIFSRFN